jgi:ribosomal-protein-alanine N-acetyltransferase
MSAVLAPHLDFLPLDTADLDEVVAIERKIYEYPWTPGNFRDSMRAGYQCRVCRNELGELIAYGVLMMGYEEAHLLNLSVSAACQRRGYGGWLLEHFFKLARQHQAKLMFLEVRPSNLAARALYEHKGFKQVGLRRGYYPSARGREDALVMSVSLA